MEELYLLLYEKGRLEGISNTRTQLKSSSIQTPSSFRAENIIT